MRFKRGEIYYVNFPYTDDPRYPKGKKKFLVVLQEGKEFNQRDTVVALLTTSDSSVRNHTMSVTIEKGTTKLHEETYVLCSQLYTLKKDLFRRSEVWCAGKLTPSVLDDIDEALYLGLCMGLQNENNS